MQTCCGRGLGGNGEDRQSCEALWLLPRCELIQPIFSAQFSYFQNAFA